VTIIPQEETERERKFDKTVRFFRLVVKLSMSHQTNMKRPRGGILDL